ncbi:MAG: circadian clock KaiB family protein [Nitrospiria bacterium]
MNSVSPIEALIWGMPSPAIRQDGRCVRRDMEERESDDEISQSRGGGGRPAMAGSKTYVFQLFVAGGESNSTLARGNLARLCEEHLKGRYEIEIVDVLKDAAAAHKHHVLLTPTLILIKPRPKVTVVGNLNDIRQVLAALRLIGDGR